MGISGLSGYVFYYGFYLLLGSVATKIIHMAKIFVTLVK